jgi:hypothetical protein
MVSELAGVDGAGWSDRDRLAVVTALEDLKAASAAAQARVTVAFDASHRAAHADDLRPVHATSGVGPTGSGSAQEPCPSRREGRGVAEMVALARRESPTRGDQHLGRAKALVNEMPLLHGLLTRGQVSEWVATKVVQGTATLTREDRQTADARLARVLPGLGPNGAAAAARRVAAELDAASVVRRMAAAVGSRRVTVRPAPAGMAYLTVLAPLVEAVGAFAALGRDADAVVGGHGSEPSGGRSRGQLMSDLAIGRMGGLTPGQVQPVEIQLVMSDTSLLGQGSTARDAGPGGRRSSEQAPVEVVGFGPVPAAFVRDRLRHGTAATRPSGRSPEAERRCGNGHLVDLDPPPLVPGEPGPATDPGLQEASVWLRRLYTSPDGRDLVAMDSRRRTFGGLLRHFLVLRDQTCRVPWCEAPIRAIDHATPAARGGPTDAHQGDATCVRHNTVKEEPGWAFTVTHDGLDPGEQIGPADRHRPHTMRIRTPAGTAYTSTAPPLLGWGSREPAEDRGPSRLLMATENRTLESMQARLNRGEDFNDAEWRQYGHLTYLATG